MATKHFPCTLLFLVLPPVTFSQAIVRSFQQTAVPLTEVEVRGDKVIFAGSGVDAGSYAYRVYVGDKDGNILKTIGANLPAQRPLRDMWVSTDGSLVYGLLDSDTDTVTIFKCDTNTGTVTAQRDLSTTTFPWRITAHSVAVDGAGNVYVAGSFQDTNLKWAAYLAKYDSNLNLQTYYASPFNNNESVYFDKVLVNPWGGLTTLGDRQTTTNTVEEIRTWTTNLAQTNVYSVTVPQTLSWFALGDVNSDAVYMANSVFLPYRVFVGRRSSGGFSESLTLPGDLRSYNCSLGSNGFFVCGNSISGSQVDPMFYRMSLTSPLQPLTSQIVQVPGYNGTALAIAEKSGGCVLAGTTYTNDTGPAFVSWQNPSGATIYQDMILGGVQQPNDLAVNPFQNKVYIASQTTGNQSYKGQLTVFVDEPPLDPSTFTITQGKVLSGNLASLTSADGDTLTVLPRHLDIQAEFTATSPYDEQFAINVVLAGTTGVPANVTIEMWNWSTSEWDVCGTGTQGTQTTQVLAPIGATPDRYVETGTRHLRGRISYRFQRPAMGSLSSNSENMLAKIDLVKVYVTAP